MVSNHKQLKVQKRNTKYLINEIELLFQVPNMLLVFKNLPNQFCI